MPWFGSAIEQPGCQRAIAGAGSKSARSTVISMDAREQLRILSHRAELFFSAGILRSSVIFVIFVALMAYKQDQAAAPQGGCDETPTQCRRRVMASALSVSASAADRFDQKLPADKHALHALNRLTFGARAADLAEVKRLGARRGRLQPARQGPPKGGPHVLRPEQSDEYSRERAADQWADDRNRRVAPI